MTSILEVEQLDTLSSNASSTLTIGGDNTTTINLGASGKTISVPSGATFTNNGTASGFGKFETQLLHVRDEKANSTDGGACTGGSFQTRDLNTILTNEISGASLSSNQITLPSGTYFIISSAPAYVCGRHKAKLRNITDSSDTLIGTSEYSAASAQTLSFISGRFTIASSKTFEIQHYPQNTVATNGFGVRTIASVVEVYTNVQIWKVA